MGSQVMCRERIVKKNDAERFKIEWIELGWSKLRRYITNASGCKVFLS